MRELYTRQVDENLDMVHDLCGEFEKHNQINPALYKKIEVKRGLRNADGTGVVAGITQIANVRGYYIDDGEKTPMEGQLIYRGINVEDLVNGFIKEKRFGFEETAYLLLLGALPTKEQLDKFKEVMAGYRNLPFRFTEDMILAAPSSDIMNKLARSVLAMYSYDHDADNKGIENELRQALQLVARFPTIVAHAFAAKRHYYDGESLYLHSPKSELSTSENFLYSVRHDNQFTETEAKVLDLCMVLHADHGGGNNSAFACRVLSSSGTDIYSSIAAAVGSLKGPRHGGANKKVMEMFGYIESEVSDWSNESQVRDELVKLLKKETGDRSGLIYGMGHAIYTKSDPRAKLLKKFAAELAKEKHMEEEFGLFQAVEKLTPEVFAEITGHDKAMCANVDLYSGFVYKMLNIPMELYTPLFAMARIVGWCAHRVEEVYNPGNKIIRPAYKAVAPRKEYTPMESR